MECASAASPTYCAVIAARRGRGVVGWQAGSGLVVLDGGGRRADWMVEAAGRLQRGPADVRGGSQHDGVGSRPALAKRDAKRPAQSANREEAPKLGCEPQR